MNNKSTDVDDIREFNRAAEAGAEPVVRFDEGGRNGCKSSRFSLKNPLVGNEEASQVTQRAATSGDQMWAVYGGRNYSACEKAMPQLPPGQYTIDYNDSIGLHFRSAEINLDTLMRLPDSKAEEIIQEIETFWKKEEVFRNFGYLWKRGVLLYGSPGGGKTSCLQQVSNQLVDHGGISIYVERPAQAAKGLAILRRVEPDRPIIVMLEDIDAIIDNHGESDLLALMDGELQIDNVVFIATTNYPERLDKRFVNRPSRFDTIKKIGMPSEAARALYLRTKNSRLADDEHELEAWVGNTQGFSIAHLKELIVSIEVFDMPLDAAVSRLRAMMDHSPSSTDHDETHTFGFHQ